MTGIILRCGDGMLIANNVFDDMDYWVFDINDRRRLRGQHRRLPDREQHPSTSGRSKVYAIATALPASAVIDYNVSYNSPARRSRASRATATCPTSRRSAA